MFLCSLCNEEFQKNLKLTGTFCGHVFHQKCLNLHLHTSANCPSCKTSLKISPDQLARLSHSYAVFPLFLQDQCNKDIDTHTSRVLSRENVVLKQKVIELTQIVLLLQGEKKGNPKCQESHAGDRDTGFSGSSYKSWTDEESKTSRTKQLLPCKTISVKTNYLSDDMAQWTESIQSVSEAEKERIIRSKRREYLTWRNKTRSWLSKMEKASDKLLRAEACFTQQEYHEQLLQFQNKLSVQGRIMETTEKASLIYLVIGDATEMEKNAILENMRHLITMYGDIKLKIANRLDIVKTSLNNNEPEITNCIAETLNNSLNGMDEIERLKKLSSTKQQLKHEDSLETFKKFVLDMNDSYREPIFV